MFNLEQAISEWRGKMIDGGIRSREVLDELEGHLRDDFEHQLEIAPSADAAFAIATKQLGYAEVLTKEFAKIGEMNVISRWLKNFFLTLAGIPSASLATNMNTSSPNTNMQPAWATYLKSGAYVLPAVTLWLLVVVFVFPKLNQMCHQAGVTIPGVYYLALSLTQHGLLVGGGILAAIFLLERRSERWARYRRAMVGVGVFVINSAVLLLIAVMVLLATLAAAHLSNHIH